MKKDKILKSSLSTLLKRFSNTDLISNLSKEYPLTAPGQVSLAMIRDNSVLKSARVNEASLQKVARIISEKGILSPLYLINRGEYYELLYSRIIYKAARRLKWENVPCILIDINDDDALIFLAVMLLQEKEPNIIELSLVFNKIKKQLKYTQREIALAAGISRSQVTNIMRLINMPTPILNEMADGKLSFGHVRALSTLDEKDIYELVEETHAKHLSVHDLEKLVYLKKHKMSSDVDEINLSKQYGCKVKSNVKQITFSFDSEEEKQNFINKISH